MDTKVMLDYGGPEFVAPGKKGFAVAPFKTYGFTAGSLNSAKNRLIKKISKDNDDRMEISR